MTEENSTTIDLVGHQIFGDYEVIRKLGEGGMGAVFLAKHRVIDQKIAIKVLHTDAASSEELVERFNREAHVISLLSHPNIIRVFVFGRTPDDLMFLAMEYVEGMSLADYYDEYGFPDELTAIKIVQQICSAVAEAHDLSIVHRDLKPENVLLTHFRGEEHYVKILDFGIAKMIEDKDQKRLTQAGIVYGTPDYLAPEQAMAQHLDGRCDIYSIGVMLFEIMTGRLPFIRENVLKTLQAHAFEPAPDPEGYTDRPVSKTMRKIIMKCLEKKREDRYQNALELYDALTEREVEILNARNLRRMRVPGSEVTSIFSGLVMSDDKSAKSAPAGDSREESTLDLEPKSSSNKPAGQARGRDSEPEDHAKTEALRGPSAAPAPLPPHSTSQERLDQLRQSLPQSESATIVSHGVHSHPNDPKVRTLVNRSSSETNSDSQTLPTGAPRADLVAQPPKFPPIVIAALISLFLLLVIAIVLLVLVLQNG